MKLRSDELKKRAAQVGVTEEQLVQAVAGRSLSEKSASSAVKNWLGGRDHPRCRKADIEALATAVGCLPKDISKFTSQVRNHRGSQKKAKLVVDMIRGKTLDQATQMLQFSTKRASVNIGKALLAAQADAEQLGADTGELFVCEATVDRATHIKRFRPKDRGRAHPILKRTSHITVSVQERS
jgi:large subunit ribosomal protein L22